MNAVRHPITRTANTTLGGASKMKAKPKATAMTPRIMRGRTGSLQLRRTTPHAACRLRPTAERRRESLRSTICGRPSFGSSDMNLTALGLHSAGAICPIRKLPAQIETAVDLIEYLNASGSRQSSRAEAISAWGYIRKPRFVPTEPGRVRSCALL